MSDDSGRDKTSVPPPQAFLEALKHPLVDRLIAILACIPFIGVVIYRIKLGIFDIPRMVIILEMLLQILPMILRRTPQRITPAPAYWLLAFLATYWPFATAGFAEKGHPMLGTLATDVLALLSLTGTAYARISLGRNVSVIPSQRNLVRSGAYRVVRHPVYSMSLAAYIAFVLSSFSITNLLLVLVGIFLLAFRSVTEERFLSADPAYREYMRQVRWRWVPGVA